MGWLKQRSSTCNGLHNCWLSQVPDLDGIVHSTAGHSVSIHMNVHPQDLVTVPAIATKHCHKGFSSVIPNPDWIIFARRNQNVRFSRQKSKLINCTSMTFQDLSAQKEGVEKKRQLWQWSERKTKERRSQYSEHPPRRSLKDFDDSI